MKIKALIEKLRNYPDNQKKIIVFSIVGVLGLIMLLLWFPYFLKRMDALSKSVPEIKFPAITTETETQNETKDWDTYNNEEYGFEIKYPNEINVKETTESSVFKLDFVKEEKILMTISVYKNEVPDYEIVMENVKIAGTDAKIIREKNLKNLNCFTILFENKDKNYFIDDNCQQENYNPDNKNSDVLYEIIATFKFT